MATTKVSALTALTSPDGAEELLINDGGTSKKVTIANANKKLFAFLDANGNYMQTEKGADIVSASPLVITTVGDYFDVTGTTNFAVMTVAADRQFTLQFDAILTMTHDATDLDLPGEANITTAAGDVATFQSTGANTVQCISYTRAAGTAVVGSSDLPTAPSGISNDTNKEYNLKLTDSGGTETLTWVEETDNDTTYSAGTALDLSTTTFNVDLSELTTSTSDADGDYFVVTDAANAQHKLTKANIALSGMNNDSSWTANTGTMTDLVNDTTPQLGGDLDCNGAQIQWSKGSDVASATALPLLTDGNYFDVTGTATVTSFNSTGGTGTQIKLHFDAACTLTHNADIILPGGANIVTAAGDEAEFIQLTTDAYRCTNYSKASGEAVVGGAGATGGGSDEVFYENGQTVTTNYELTAGKNAMSAGAITINSSIAVTVPSGATWVIV